ncbi:Tetratricopeptide repeat protein [Pirellulimonas nuda]|uniref:Tetratricopeptide repeat protein n=1 Tax=Pirellulimonas nuda TaxID=2528009 RepID=A0A518DDI7_9BACT|nr:hypothetical protein [Pirellulimonas nuda]QDU89541.1 Tetratricopeptide repeat protein [Pirellulimonas nuda]
MRINAPLGLRTGPLIVAGLMVFAVAATARGQAPEAGPAPDASQAVVATPEGKTPGVCFYPGLDRYTRRVTTRSAEAQRWFDQGIQLLYGFNHDEAIRSFEQASRIDPACAMAWWGAAYARGMHINNPEMSEDQSRLAYEAAQKALALLDDESPVERALVRAVAQRYAMPAPEDRAELDQAYADAMEMAWRKFPDDADVGALYAESLMDLQPWDLWTPQAAPKGRALEVLAVLERTMSKSPNHPGANHFYIHAIEASPWPERGTQAAERLATLAPGSGHLVHMPSHIYIRTGRYADAVTANERALRADEAYLKLAPPPEFYNVYYLHNAHFLAYSAMMEGRYQTAIDAARKIESQIPASFLKQYVAIADGFMPTTLHVQIRFGKWEDVLAEPEPPSWRLFSLAEWRCARCVALAVLGRTEQAHEELVKFDAVAAQITDEWLMGNNQAADVLAVARAMAAGELAFHEGDKERAFELLRQGVVLEESLSYDEPPGWMQPVRHALGALLLADARHAEAEGVYRSDLARHPNNAWALLGLQQSLGLQGKTAEADALAESVRQAWARADVQPIASCYCHPDALLLHK